MIQTSELDRQPEQAIMEALERLMKNRTSIVIVRHRGAILHDAILITKDPCLVEDGSHDQLLAAGGLYARLY